MQNTISSIICSYIAEFKLRFYVLLDTNTGLNLNFLLIVEVPSLGKCSPGRPHSPPFRYATDNIPPMLAMSPKPRSSWENPDRQPIYLSSDFRLQQPMWFPHRSCLTSFSMVQTGIKASYNENSYGVLATWKIGSFSAKQWRSSELIKQNK